jgi:hypothetical protein
LTLTDPAVLAGEARAFRGVLGDSSCFGFGALFEAAFEAGAGALAAVFFEEGATFDFAVAMLARRDGGALFVNAPFFAPFAFSSFLSRLTEPVDFRGAGAGSDLGFALEALFFCLSSVVDLPFLLFFFSAAVDLVIAFCFASLISFSIFARCVELVVGFFGTVFSLVEVIFLEVPVDVVRLFEDEVDGLALDVVAALEVDAAFSAGLPLAFVEEVFDDLSLTEAVERRALAVALGLLLSLKGLFFLAFVSADFFAAATFTFSAMDYIHCQWRLGVMRV